MDIKFLGRIARLSFVAVITATFCNNLTAEQTTNGYGVYEEFGAPLYAVKLEVEQRIENSAVLLADDHQKTLSLRVLSDTLGQRQWCRFWTQNIAINISAIDLDTLADSVLSVCDHISGDLALGDQIVFYRESSEQTLLKVNDIDFGELKGPGIFEAFLSPFIGNSPVSNNLKTALLNQPNESSEAARTYLNSSISPERIELVQKWVAPPEPQPIQEPAQDPEFTAANAKNPAEATALTSSVLHSVENFADAKKSTEVRTWSTVSAEEQGTTYEISDFSHDPVMASAAYMPNSSTLFSSTALDLNQIRPKEKLTRISLLDIQEYQEQSLRRVYEFIEYPSIALRRGREGSLRLKVEIDRSGNIRQISSLETTRHDVLNEAAEFAVEQAGPFEPPPLAEDEEIFELLLPIRFSLE